MSRLVAICQPHYIPWIGYFEMIDRVDEFVFHDDVDLIMREWKTRNRIRKDPVGSECKWLTVPIEHGCQVGTHICDARIAGDRSWRRKHLAYLRHSYLRSPYFEQADELLRAGLGADVRLLGELNMALVREVCAYLGVDTPLRRASQLGTRGRKTDKLLAICQALSATSYLANNGSAGYLELERFASLGLECTYQDYQHPRYAQGAGGVELPFVSHLSVLDLIANHGPAALEVIRSGRPQCAT